VIDTDVLRNKILYLALKGDLTRSHIDHNVDNNLFTKLKKHNSKVCEHSENENLPFEISQNWKWVQLGDVFAHNTGKALNSSSCGGIELRYITTSNVYWDRFELDEVRTMSFNDEEIEKCTVTKGDLLVCEGGDIGRSAIWDKNFNICIQNHLHRLRPEIDGICVKFYYYVLMYYKNSHMIDGRGIGLQGLSSKRLHHIVVPLPPEKEQPLVVKKIDDIFSVLSTIDDIQTKYAADRNVLKSKLIDAAICGKLTRQLPEDGTAEKLYQKIQEEKKRLENEGKIKKSKKLPEIADDEIPFEIPENWRWVRLGNISFSISAGGDKPSDFQTFEDKVHRIPVVANGIDRDGVIGFTGQSGENKNTITVAGRGTIGFTVYRDYEYFPVVRLIVINPSTILFPQYLKYVLERIDFKSTGSSIPQLTVPTISPCLIPLPPRNEQIRIVETLDNLLMNL
jgi:type I restriction enzyme S subunit